MILHEMDISHRKKSFTELMSQVNRRCNLVVHMLPMVILHAILILRDETGNNYFSIKGLLSSYC